LKNATASSFAFSKPALADAFFRFCLDAKPCTVSCDPHQRRILRKHGRGVLRKSSRLTGMHRDLRDDVRLLFDHLPQLGDLRVLEPHVVGREMPLGRESDGLVELLALRTRVADDTALEERGVAF
jgi:hypothetical protein